MKKAQTLRRINELADKTVEMLEENKLRKTSKKGPSDRKLEKMRKLKLKQKKAEKKL